MTISEEAANRLIEAIWSALDEEEAEAEDVTDVADQAITAWGPL